MSNSYGILGYPSNWARAFGSSTIPPDYFLPAIQQGFRLTRRKVRRDVDTAMPIDQTQPIIRWKIPSNAATILDFRRSAVYITFSVAVTAPAVAAPSNLAWNIIERVRLEQAGNYIEDRRYFNVQESFLYTFQTHIQQQLSTAVELYGAGSLVTRQGRAGGYKYCLPLPFSSLTKAVMPFFAMGRANGIMPMAGQDIILQWELAQPSAFIEVTGGAAVGLAYQVTKMEIEYDECSIDSGPAAFISRWFEATNKCPRVLFKSMWTNLYNLSTATQQDVLIDVKLQSIIALFATFRDGAQTNIATTLDKFETFLSKSTIFLQDYQWEVNGNLWPDKVVDCTDTQSVPAYVNYLETFQMFHARRVNEEVTPISASQFNNDKFLVCFDGNVHPFSMNMLSPISTSDGNSQVHLRLNFTAAPPANLQVVFHAMHYKIWNYNCSGASGSIVET